MANKKDDDIFQRAVGKWQRKVNQGVDPFFHTDPNKPNIIEPLILIDNHPNDEDHFAILKTTENGKYVRGGMLHFEFNGVDITTEINNVIFIDVLNKAILIKDYSKVTEEITPVDPEERQYIILYSYETEDGYEYHWEAMQGRLTMYEWIRDNIDDYLFNPEEALVLVETVPYKDAMTVSAFIKYLQNAEFVEKDEIDIDDYVQ